MSRAWGRAASALGNGILQIGMMNQRERMEAQRQANMERLRQENREYNAGLLEDKNARQDQLISDANTRQDGLLEAANTRADANAAKDRTSRENVAGIKGGNTNNNDKLVLGAYSDVKRSISNSFKQLEKIDADKDRVWDDGEKSALRKSLNAHIKKGRDQMSHMEKNNPFLANIYGTESPLEEKAKRNPFDVPTASQLKDDIASGKTEPLAIPDSQKVKTPQVSGSKSDENKQDFKPNKNKPFDFMHASKEQKEAFIRKVEESNLAASKKADEFLEREFETLSDKEKVRWLKKNKKPLGDKFSKLFIIYSTRVNAKDPTLTLGEG